MNPKCSEDGEPIREMDLATFNILLFEKKIIIQRIRGDSGARESQISQIKVNSCKNFNSLRPDADAREKAMGAIAFHQEKNFNWIRFRNCKILLIFKRANYNFNEFHGTQTKNVKESKKLVNESSGVVASC